MPAATYVVSSASIALSASTTKSLWLVTPTVVGFRLTEVALSFDGSTAATAIQVGLYRTTTLGAPTGSAGTFAKGNQVGAHAAQSTALTNLTAEPTAVEILRQWFVSPASGLLVLQFPLGREPEAAAGGQSIGLRCLTPAGVTPDAIGYAEIEE